MMSAKAKQGALSAPCPCCSHNTFGSCCYPIISGEYEAPTAEAVMRARYTAFTIGDLDFVEKTTDENALQSFNRLDIEKSLPDTEWLGLEVRGTTEGLAGDDTGTVSFAFRYIYGGREIQQVEIASFSRLDGKWLFQDSEINPKSPPVRVESVGRNDPCMCGSGKKYKKCCGAVA